VKHSTGLYPRVRVDRGGVGSVSQAGAVLLLETIRATGLDGELRAALARWRKPTAVHDPAGTVWRMSRCCGGSQRCSGWSGPTRRSAGWSRGSAKSWWRGDLGGLRYADGG
jgi:hypothetical protein